jgi:hypothetical protein
MLTDLSYCRLDPALALTAARVPGVTQDVRVGVLVIARFFPNSPD